MMNELQIKVAQAVHVLNHDAQSCNRVAANQWLVQFQQTDAAWEVATSLLTSPDRLLPCLPLSFEVEFFAAQILRRKVSSDYRPAYQRLLLLYSREGESLFRWSRPQASSSLLLLLVAVHRSKTRGITCRLESKTPCSMLFSSLPSASAWARPRYAPLCFS